MTAMPDSGIYLITRDTADTGKLLGVVQQALEGGVVLVQYRDKSGDQGRRVEQAHALVAACRPFQVPLLINDDVRLAGQVGAAGVHLGEHDVRIGTARAQLGAKALIGVSCYNDLSRAQALAALEPDYLAFGSFFDSPTKPDARRADPQLLRDARRLGLPVVAIGGINSSNGASLCAAGADLLAVISAVFDADDPALAARQMARCFDT